MWSFRLPAGLAPRRTRRPEFRARRPSERSRCRTASSRFPAAASPSANRPAALVVEEVDAVHVCDDTDVLADPRPLSRSADHAHLVAVEREVDDVLRPERLDESHLRT